MAGTSLLSRDMLHFSTHARLRALLLLPLEELNAALRLGGNSVDAYCLTQRRMLEPATFP